MRDATSGTGTAYNTSGTPEFNLIFIVRFIQCQIYLHAWQS